jgi:hypothetical protein
MSGTYALRALRCSSAGTADPARLLIVRRDLASANVIGRRGRISRVVAWDHIVPAAREQPIGLTPWSNGGSSPDRVQGTSEQSMDIPRFRDSHQQVKGIFKWWRRLARAFRRADTTSCRATAQTGGLSCQSL